MINWGFRALASGLGAGHCPRAPGTAGTLLAIPLAWALASLPALSQLLLLALALPAAARVCGRAAEADGGDDPGWIVLDEIVGFCFASALLAPTVVSMALAFVLFRLFDILKPPPIRWIERHFPGGWGILLDDVAAGVCARATLEVLRRAGVF